MKKIFYSLLFIISCSYISAQDVQYCEDTYSVAEDAFKRKDYKKALSYYDQVIEECKSYRDCKQKIKICKNALAEQEELQTHGSSQSSYPFQRDFHVVKNVYSCKASDRQITIVFSATPQNWYVSSTPYWLREKDGAKTNRSISFIVDENTSIQARSGVIVFVSDDGQAKASISIEQTGKEMVFEVDKKYIEFSEHGGDELVQIKTNCLWDIHDAPDWVNLKRTVNALSISCGTNYYSYLKEDDIILINEGGKKIRLTVTQNKNSDYLRLSAKSIEESKGKGKTYIIHVNSNTAWYIKKKPYWCKTEIVNNDLEVTLERNRTGCSRTGEIEVVADRSDPANHILLKSVISVQQGKLQQYIFISPRIIEEGTGKGGYATYKVDTDFDGYQIEGLPFWCKVDQRTQTFFRIDIKDNNGGNAREAHGRVVAGSESEPFVIKQAERLVYVDVMPTKVTAPKNGGTITIRVSSSGTWRVVNLPDWCDITQQTEEDFTLTILPNAEGPRTGTFSVSSLGERETVFIKQD